MGWSNEGRKACGQTGVNSSLFQCGRGAFCVVDRRGRLSYNRRPITRARFSTVVENLWIFKQIAPVLPLMNVWNQLLARIEQIIDRTDYETWFVQSALHRWWRRPRQNPSDPGHRSEDAGKVSEEEGRLHVGRQLRDRPHHLDPLRQDDAVPRALSDARRAAARRHPVPRRQGTD